MRDVFCGAEAPEIRGLTDLHGALGLSFADGYAGQPGGAYGGALDAGLVVLGHSTALSGAHVSPINPRVIALSDRAFVAFNRGVQQVELAARDREHHGFNFYLLSFEQACNAAPSGCTPGDLYTPRVETDWLRIRIEDDEDLKNTPSDCRQCHQRGTDSAIVLMRELDGPWTHFFLPEVPGNDFPEATGKDLMADYVQAKGDEVYGGIPGSALRATAGITLQNAMRAQQPLLFDSSSILNERWPWSAPGGYAATPVRSITWDLNYAAFKRGEQLPLPHPAPNPADPEKQAQLTDAYRRYRAGELPAEELTDLADIFPDDATVRAELGFLTEPSATPAELLVQACAPCHNDVLDQTISRARFSVDVTRMERAELDLAVERLERGAHEAGVMPPPGRRQLDAEGRARLVEYLRAGTFTSDESAFLEHAARMGMAGPQVPSLYPSFF